MSENGTANPGIFGVSSTGTAGMVGGTVLAAVRDRIRTRSLPSEDDFSRLAMVGR
ncbi:hypothetical protein [Nocardia sp. NPDC004711]